MLRETPKASDHVFVSRLGGSCTVAGLRSICRRRLDCTPYDLRHTFAAACIDTGLLPEVVTKMMGHRTSDMVWTYARIREEQMVEAAAKLKLRSDTA